MSASEARRFLDDLEGDSEFQAQLSKFKEMPQRVLGELRKRGYNCTPEEVFTELVAMNEVVLDEKQLHEIAAGKASPQTIAAYTVGAVMTAAAVAAAAAA